MYLIHCNITLHKKDGEIFIDPNEKLLRETFKSFPEFQKPETDVLLFSHSNKSLIINPNQYTYAYIGDYDDLDIDEAVDNFQKANTALNLGDEGVSVITLELTDEVMENSLEKSLKLNGDLALKLDAIGVGQRFIINTDNIRGNIFIEPFVHDSNKVFYRLELQSKNITSSDEWKESFMAMLNYVSKASEVAKSIYE